VLIFLTLQAIQKNEKQQAASKSNGS
jgi:hypothetical protein